MLMRYKVLYIIIILTTFFLELSLPSTNFIRSGFFSKSLTKVVASLSFTDGQETQSQNNNQSVPNPGHFDSDSVCYATIQTEFEIIPILISETKYEQSVQIHLSDFIHSVFQPPKTV